MVAKLPELHLQPSPIVYLGHGSSPLPHSSVRGDVENCMMLSQARMGTRLGAATSSGCSRQVHFQGFPLGPFPPYFCKVLGPHSLGEQRGGYAVLPAWELRP